MSAPLPADATIARDAHDQFVVSHGKGGVLGVFTANAPLILRRGQRVLVKTTRGFEFGAVLRAATHRQAMLLGATSSGELLRAVTAEDDARGEKNTAVAQRVFEMSRDLARRGSLALEILDVDLLFDGLVAIVQFLGKEADTENLAEELEREFRLTIRFENLAVAAASEPDDPGCDKPDCGRTASGGCTTCSTGGGCGSCGSGKVEMRDYFSHLRKQMEETHRIPLT